MTLGLKKLKTTKGHSAATYSQKPSHEIQQLELLHIPCGSDLFCYHSYQWQFVSCRGLETRTRDQILGGGMISSDLVPADEWPCVW